MEASERTEEPVPADAPPTGDSPAAAHAAAETGSFAGHPEVFVGAAFAGGLALAGLMRWLDR